MILIFCPTDTTGFGQFAWCLKHQAKVKKHPTTNLPRATPGKQHPALGK